MADTEAEETETKLYYLKPGLEHNVIVAGELKTLKGDDGDATELSNSQYESFKDKFLPHGQKPQLEAPVEESAPEPGSKPTSSPTTAPSPPPPPPTSSPATTPTTGGGQ